MSGINPTKLEMEEMMTRLKTVESGTGAGDIDFNNIFDKDSNTTRVVAGNMVSPTNENVNGKMLRGYKMQFSLDFQSWLKTEYAKTRGTLATQPTRKPVAEMSLNERMSAAITMAYEKGYISAEVKKQLGNVSAEEVGTALGSGFALGLAARTAAGAVLLEAAAPVGLVLIGAQLGVESGRLMAFAQECGKAKTQNGLDKAAQYFGKWMGDVAKEGTLLAIGAAGGIAGHAEPEKLSKAGRIISSTYRGIDSSIKESIIEPRFVTPEGIEMMPPKTPKTPKTIDEKGSSVFESRAAKVGENGRRDVKLHETEGGHTIKMHVGKSENWLRNRLNSDSDIGDFASSFANESAANRVQGKAVNHFKNQIDKWLKGESSKPLSIKFDMKEPIGIVVERGKSGYITTSNVRVILVKDRSPQGWHFLTSFPEK